MFIRFRRRRAWKCHLDWKSVSTKDPLTNRRHTTRQTNEEGEREREKGGRKSKSEILDD